MKFQLLEQALEVLREQGLRPQIEIGAHFKVRFTNALGRPCILIVLRSPSCRLAGKRNRALLRRLLRTPKEAA
jgi:hypothetical protein